MSEASEPNRGGDHQGWGSSELEAKRCPTCLRDLPPWYADCPRCREPAVLRFGFATAALPPVPAHLRDAVEDHPAAETSEGHSPQARPGDAASAEIGAHKPDDDPWTDPRPVDLGSAPSGVPPWLGGLGGAGAAGAGGACGGPGVC